jgi:hypothetical protein
MEPPRPRALWSAGRGNPTTTEEEFMKTVKLERGEIGWIVLWLIGLPIPLLLALYFIRGCT